MIILVLIKDIFLYLLLYQLEVRKMKAKKLNQILITVIVVIMISIISYVSFTYFPIEKESETTQGIMILIEYQDTVGLSNFVNELEKRNISGLLMVTPEFVQENCEDIKEIIKHDVEIVASNVQGPFWDISYEDQKSRIIEMVDGIESCTGVPVRIISSRYMASDLTTIKVAEELGIPYITARGTTDTKATVYQPEGYNIKVLSVSNIPLVTFKYGSLCDYSFFERGGSPYDMLEELNRAVEPLTDKEKERFGETNKITPVSHTRIGGYLKPWMDMWTGFWDTSKVEWVNLDTFMENPDWIIPLWQIPLNKNSPYTVEKLQEATSYEDEQKVQNPCAVINIGKLSSEEITKEITKEYVGEKIVMYHNGEGPMCLEALEFIDTIDYSFEQHLTTDENFYINLGEVKDIYESSEGVSKMFEYYPIIFIKDKAYSGFNDDIKDEIIESIS